MSGDVEFHCGTVMPDHLHVLFTLGERLPLSRVVAKLKTLTRVDLGAGNRWQENYFDHRLRPEASLEPFARYIFLNPYRKRLLSVDAAWSGWIRNRNYTPEFFEHLRGGSFPRREWLSGELPLTRVIQDSIDSAGDGFSNPQES